jgi:hypothetical protein
MIIDDNHDGPEHICGICALHGIFKVTVLYQFILPALLTLFVVGFKFMGFVLVKTSWLYVLLPLLVSIAVGVALTAVIILLSLFIEAFGNKYE